MAAAVIRGRKVPYIHSSGLREKGLSARSSRKSIAAQEFPLSLKLIVISLFSGFLTLPTAYVTGNPVECVLHPDVWNSTSLWDPLGVGHILQVGGY